MNTTWRLEGVVVKGEQRSWGLTPCPPFPTVTAYPLSSPPQQHFFFFSPYWVGAILNGRFARCLG